MMAEAGRELAANPQPAPSVKPPVRPKSELRLFEQFNLGPLRKETLAAVTKLGKVKATSEERAAIDALDAQFVRLNKFVLEHDNRAVRRIAKAQHFELLTKVAAGTHDQEVSDANIWTKEELAIEAARKRSAAKVALREVSTKARAIMIPIAERIGKAAAALAKDIQSEEQQRAKDFGVPFQPSHTLLAVGQMSWRTQEFLPGNGYNRPGAMLEIFVGR
jgi:hypothetical protein